MYRILVCKRRRIFAFADYVEAVTFLCHTHTDGRTGGVDLDLSYTFGDVF